MFSDIFLKNRYNHKESLRVKRKERPAKGRGVRTDGVKKEVKTKEF